MKKSIFVALVLALAVGVGAGLVSARPAAAPSDLLGFLPDGNAVVVVDVRKVTTSNLWTTLSAQDKFRSGIEKLEKEMSEVGLKLADLSQMAIVFPASGLSNPTVAMSGAFNQQDLLSRLRARKDVTLTSETYKGVEIHKAARVIAGTSGKAPTRKDTAFAFHDAGTVVIGSLAGVRASIDTQQGAAPSVARNEKLAGALAQNVGSDVSFAMAVTPALTSKLQSDRVPLPDFSSINLIFGTVNFATSIDLNATLRNDTAEHAKVVADQLNSLLSMVKGFLGGSSDPKMAPIADALKTLTITNADVDVKVTGAFPMELLAQIIR